VDYEAVDWSPPRSERSTERRGPREETGRVLSHAYQVHYQPYSLRWVQAIADPDIHHCELGLLSKSAVLLRGRDFTLAVDDSVKC
jgi:hypothetical protein